MKVRMAGCLVERAEEQLRLLKLTRSDGDTQPMVMFTNTTCGFISWLIPQSSRLSVLSPGTEGRPAEEP